MVEINECSQCHAYLGPNDAPYYWEDAVMASQDQAAAKHLARENETLRAFVRLLANRAAWEPIGGELYFWAMEGEHPADTADRLLRSPHTPAGGKGAA